MRAREKLLEAGRKAFAAKGLGGASLREDILAAAGVSAGSFYHQFADKADLLVEILRCDGAGVIETLQKNAAVDAAVDPDRSRRRMAQGLVEMAERYPQFVKIFVREYHSDSPRVRRQIRRHSEQTIAHIRISYEELRERSGLPLDTDGIATLLSIQGLAVANYYLDFPKKKRAAIRGRLIRNLIQLGAGGVLAVRLPEGDA